VLILIKLYLKMKKHLKIILKQLEEHSVKHKYLLFKNFIILNIGFFQLQMQINK